MDKEMNEGANLGEILEHILHDKEKAQRESVRKLLDTFAELKINRVMQHKLLHIMGDKISCEALVLLLEERKTPSEKAVAEQVKENNLCTYVLIKEGPIRHCVSVVKFLLEVVQDNISLCGLRYFVYSPKNAELRFVREFLPAGSFEAVHDELRRMNIRLHVS